MPTLRQLVPWRFVKRVGIVSLLLIIAWLLWISVKQQYYHGNDYRLDLMHAVDVMKRKVINTVNNDVDLGDSEIQISSKTTTTTPSDDCPDCSQTNRRHGYHADITTYDLPDITDYTLDKYGKYLIPDPPESNNTDELHVILVPFSHADPGFGHTMEEYYNLFVRGILTNMVNVLSQNRNMTFQWAETVFLERWFRDIDDGLKRKVRTLIANGQLEIVLGSWVMPDEAITYYVPIIDQLIEGHQWLMENLGVKPKTAWVIDPFGYSSTMSYLWKASGIDNMVINRVHQAIKGTLMKHRNLEFNWRPYWRWDNRTDILCNVMPYPGYWLDTVCGKREDECGQFNYLHLGDPTALGISVTDNNIDRLARILYEQYKYTARFYRYDTLYMAIGEDFSFSRSQQWGDTFENYNKLMNYINAKLDWKMNIKFGTLKGYFDRIRNIQQTQKLVDGSDFPSLKGDFLPYSDYDNMYWTGFYSTRPALKKFAREIGSLIRAADIFNVLFYYKCKVANATFIHHANVAENMRLARRELGMFHHHDGITGTSMQNVVADYQVRLWRAYTKVREALKLVLSTVLSENGLVDVEVFKEGIEKKDSTSVTRTAVFDITSGPGVTKNSLRIIVVNTVEKHRNDIVDLRIKRQLGNVNVVNENGSSIPCQITRYISGDGIVLQFPVDLSPLSIKTFLVTEHASDKEVNVMVKEREHSSNREPLYIENSFMKITFDNASGMMTRIIHSDGRITNITSTLLYYTSHKSGAYIFGPHNVAKDIKLSSKITTTKGSVMSEVTIKADSYTVRFRIYNDTGIIGQGIYLRTEIDLSQTLQISNTEVILRLETDVKNNNTFYTDQNGFSLIGRKTYRNRSIESNYYPITTMAILEDETKRVTLHTAESHGFASLEEGWLEVMLDRTMNMDDGRGLGGGVGDLKQTASDLILNIEFRDTPGPLENDIFTHATLKNVVINEYLQNPILLYGTTNVDYKSRTPFTPMLSEFPPDLAIVGLRNLVKNDLSYNGTSLIVHRKGLQCGYNVPSFYVSHSTISLNTVFPAFSGQAFETSLSHTYRKHAVTPESAVHIDCNELKSFVIEL